MRSIGKIKTGRRARRAVVRLVSSALVVVLVASGAVPAAAAPQVGFKAHSFSGFGAESSGGAITGEKPESKLWFQDGSWWGSMVSPSAGGAHTIWRLGQTSWTDTGVVIDSRPESKEDVLNVGSNLYVVSRASSGNKLRRFTYTGASYQMAGGFPVTVPGAGAETLTVARDSTGRLWVTYESGSSIFVAHSLGSDTSWSAPFVIPVNGATGTSSDDISSVISFTDGTGPAVGVMWSNQNTSTDYFAVHRDGALTSTWTVETALSGAKEADDHINMKTSEGKVYVVVKTSHNGSAKPRIRLLVRSPTGAWTRHIVATVAEANTRPITMLYIDPVQDLVYVFMTIGEGEFANGISYKVSSTQSVGFPSQATIFIQGPNAEKINDPSSSKQNGDETSGVVVLASDGANYWWNRIGGGAPPNTPPTATPGSAVTTVGTPVGITLGATDAETCELSFSIAQQPNLGMLGPLGAQTCSPGTPNSDRVDVTYSPNQGASGPDSFTYSVTDGGGASATAVVTLTISGPSAGIAFRSSSSAANVPSTSLTIPAPPGIVADDVLVAVVDARGNPNITPPAGWALVRLDINGNLMRQGVYARVAGANPPVSYTWTLSGSQSAAGGISAYSGVDAAAPIITHSGQVSATGTGNTIQAPSVTTTVDGAMILGFFGVASNTSVAPPGEMTERYDVVSNAGRFPIVASSADLLQSFAGATGNVTALAGTTGWSIGQLVALRPGGSPPNAPPAAISASASTASDTAVEITLNATDPETCELTFSVVQDPSHGSLGPLGEQPCTSGTPNADRVDVTYTPAPGFSGSDSFAFRANDGSADSSQATVSITVQGGDAPPTAAPVAAGGPQGQPVLVGLRGTDTETCELTFEIVAGPSNGSLSTISEAPCSTGSPNSDTGSVTYTPAPGFSGADSFTYSVTDGAGASATAVASLTITSTSSGITFRSPSSAANVPSTSLTIPAPPGIVADDVLVAVVDARGNPTITAPAGWTLVRLDISGNVVRQGVYVRVAGPSPPGSYTWTLSNAQSAAGGIAAYAGVDTSSPIMTHSGQISPTSGTKNVVAPSVTTTAEGAMILGFFGVSNNTSVTAPIAMSERFDVVSNAGTYPVVASGADVLQTTAGDTGSMTAVSGTTGWNIGQLVALRRRVP